MGEASSSEDKILDVTERMIRSRGYNGFSFREIAAEIGVKSSTVHYYFPTKEALGARIAQRYTTDFLQALGPPDDQSRSAQDIAGAIRRLARNSLVNDKLMCLCGMLGAEVADLPPEVAKQSRSFFVEVSAWLQTALRGSEWGRHKSEEDLRKVSLTILATIEGALIVARALGDPDVFDEISLPGLTR